MSLTGSLATMELSELLQWISLGRKTGCLAFIRGKVKNGIYFQDGRIISSRSNEPTRQLGHFLLFQGKLSEADLKRALDEQRRTKKLLGRILVEGGRVSQAEVENALIHRTEEVIYDLFLWDEGQFHFTRDGYRIEDLILINLDINAILFEGVRRKDEWGRIRQAFPDNHAVPVLRPGADPRGMDLTPMQKKLLFLITRGKSLAEMVLELHGSEFQVSFELFQLHELRLIEVRAAPSQPPKTESATARLFSRGLELVRLCKYREALEAFREIQRLDPSSTRVDEQIEAAERALCEEIYQRSLPAFKVPRLLVPESGLARHNLNHEEGFVASRINGAWDVRTIVMLSPLREIDILNGLEKLLRLGVIDLL